MGFEYEARAIVSRSLKHEILTDEEVLILLKGAANGDAEAVEQLVAYNQRLVASIARRYNRHLTGEMEFSDLMQAGNMGLYKAIQLWDGRKKAKFGTYAYYWIRAYIRRLALHRSTSLSVSFGFSEKLAAMRSARTALMQELDREPTAVEIAERTRISEKEVELGLSAILQTVSLEQKVRGDRDHNIADERGDAIPDLDQNTEESALSMALLSQAQTAIRGLPDHYQSIMRQRYGLDGHEVRSQAEIAEHLGVTRQYIDHVEKAAIRLIRQSMVLRDRM